MPLPRMSALTALFVLCSNFPSVEMRAAESRLWSQLYSADFHVFAQNLRGAGVPEATVGLLISQEVNARFHDRERALQPSLGSLDRLKQEWSAERREALVQLKREKNDLLRSILRLTPEETAKTAAVPEPLVHLTREQREIVALITEDYDAMTARVFAESGGVLFGEDREKLRYLETARDADLFKAIGYEASIDYQISLSRHMRFNPRMLRLFKPTRQELRDIFLARRKHAFQLVSYNTANPGESMTVKKAVQDDLAKAWGPERFAQYARYNSPVYLPIHALVERLGHPAAVADQIYDSQKNARDGAARRMDELRALGSIRVRDGEPRPESASDVAKRLIAEHVAFVKQLLGEAGYAEYYRMSSSIIDRMLKGAVIRISFRHA